jgi:hypothetical protein
VAAGYLKRILRGIEVFFTGVAQCASDRAAEFKGGILIVNGGASTVVERSLLLLPASLSLFVETAPAIR